MRTQPVPRTRRRSTVAPALLFSSVVLCGFLLAGLAVRSASASGDAAPSAAVVPLFDARTVRDLGLLEAIPEDAILAQADPDDRDGDGVSGRTHVVTDPESGVPRLGRFGWKPAQATRRVRSGARRRCGASGSRRA